MGSPGGLPGHTCGRRRPGRVVAVVLVWLVMAGGRGHCRRLVPLSLFGGIYPGLVQPILRVRVLENPPVVTGCGVVLLDTRVSTSPSRVRS